MSKKTEIVDVAIEGWRPERIPFSCWYHFGLHHLPGKAHAEVELGFYRHYDLDFLKVMDDYGYPFPQGFDWFRTPSDYERLVEIRYPRDFVGYREQLECIEVIARSLEGEAYFINTVFSPFTWLRNYGYGVWQGVMREHPEKFLLAMEVATRNITNYVRALSNAGVSGIFYSQPAADPRFMTRAEFGKFVKPFDIRVLAAAWGLPMNVLHVHGKKIYLDEFYDYPVKIVNYSDRFKDNPSLKVAKSLNPKWCLMGGINEETLKESDPELVDAEIEDAYKQTGGMGWISTPGCSITTNTWESHIHRMRDKTRAL